jgi:hypothetical protein
MELAEERTKLKTAMEVLKKACLNSKMRALYGPGLETLLDDWKKIDNAVSERYRSALRKGKTAAKAEAKIKGWGKHEEERWAREWAEGYVEGITDVLAEKKSRPKKIN